LEREYWSSLKTFLVFLNRWPEHLLDDVNVDDDVKEYLSVI